METQYNLVNYGIQNEISHIRAHVGVLAKTVYVFRTKYWEIAISQSQASLLNAYQSNIKYATATGYAVPLKYIPDLRSIPIKNDELWNCCNITSSCESKGKFAINVVRYLLHNGEFPLWFDQNNTLETTDKKLQIEGSDIILACNKKIQVKCDYKAGIGPGCTGNLYLQISERNPLKII